MRLPLQIISFSFALLIVSQNAYAGAWILKRGEFWVRSSFHYLNTNERYYSRNTPCPLNENCTKAGQRVKFGLRWRRPRECTLSQSPLWLIQLA